MLKLVAFDGDNTLWTPLSGLNLSDRTPTDDVGNETFDYRASASDPLLVTRDDGALFSLRPEAPEVLHALRDMGILVGVISYNHAENVRRILARFGLDSLVDYVVAEWHTDKDLMLRKMLAQARADGHAVLPGEALLVDDDPSQIYRGQCERMGACFTRFGWDIRDLREVLAMVPSPADGT